MLEPIQFSLGYDLGVDCSDREVEDPMGYAQLLILSLLLLMYVSSSQQTDSSPPKPSVYGDAEAYDVYSAALPLDSAYQDSKAVLILQSVPPSE